MLSLIAVCITAAAVGTPLAATARPQASDLAELRRLEVVWNEAHMRGDTTALTVLWDDDLTVTVPEMPPMTKSDLLAFWRSGRSAITRYETSDLQIRVYENAGVVTGRLQRERNFNGQKVRDDWRFLKVYVRRGGQWRVVAYQASVAPTK
jgi:ketosteroid isomerase-like protein